MLGPGPCYHAFANRTWPRYPGLCSLAQALRRIARRRLRGFKRWFNGSGWVNPTFKKILQVSAIREKVILNVNQVCVQDNLQFLFYPLLTLNPTIFQIRSRRRPSNFGLGRTPRTRRRCRSYICLSHGQAICAHQARRPFLVREHCGIVGIYQRAVGGVKKSVVGSGDLWEQRSGVDPTACVPCRRQKRVSFWKFGAKVIC